MTTKFTPNDPLFGAEWYLRNTGQSGGGVGIDLNVSSVWPDYTGRGIKVAITDDGVQLNHPDLAAHLDVANSYDSVTNTTGNGAGNPTGVENNHGTAVAGIVGAVGNNGLGTVGVAYDSTLISYLIPLHGESSGNLVEEQSGVSAITRAFQKELADKIDVTNNSWGTSRAFGHNWSLPSDERDAITALASKGRYGFGTDIVFAAGNDRGNNSDAMLDNMLNSRFVITVAAVSNNGTASSYSSMGADILVSGFGGGNSPGQLPGTPGNAMTTTDRTGVDGYNMVAGTSGDYTSNMNGTSAASPSVAGVVALMLQAAPWLGYRDVQSILAYSARFNDPSSKGWGMNFGPGANGGGLHYSREYGFGLVDAHAAVRLAEVWSGRPHTEVNLKTLEATASGGNPAAGTRLVAQVPLTLGFDIGQSLVTDRIEVNLGLIDPNPSTLLVQLVGPNGQSINLVQLPGNTLDRNDLDAAVPVVTALPWPSSGFVLDTPAFMGADAKGHWSINIVDTSLDAAGVGAVFQYAELTALGDTPVDPPSMIFTDDFATLAARDPSRLLIGTVGQTSRLNAAAMSSDVTLDLSGQRASMVAGKTILLTPGAKFDRLYGGDGDDVLVGDGTGQMLYGGRGNNVIDGGTVTGGATAGESTAVYIQNRSKYAILSAGGTTTVHDLGTDPGVDTVSHVAKMQFLDGTLYTQGATDTAIDAAIYYTALLGRAPDAGGFRYWSTATDSASDIGQSFLGSSEFASGLGQESNTQFVTDLYSGLMGRSADAGGVGFWVSALQAGQSRAAVALQFGQSSEFTANRMSTMIKTIGDLGNVWAV